MVRTLFYKFDNFDNPDTFNYHQSMSDTGEKIIIYQSYDTAVEANLAKTKLDAYGIPCFLTDENFVGIYPIRNNVFPGVRLHIFENDLHQAADILRPENWKTPHRLLYLQHRQLHPPVVGAALIGVVGVYGFALAIAVCLQACTLYPLPGQVIYHRLRPALR